MHLVSLFEAGTIGPLEVSSLADPNLFLPSQRLVTYVGICKSGPQ